MNQILKFILHVDQRNLKSLEVNCSTIHLTPLTFSTLLDKVYAYFA